MDGRVVPGIPPVLAIVPGAGTTTLSRRSTATQERAPIRPHPIRPAATTMSPCPRRPHRFRPDQPLPPG